MGKRKKYPKLPNGYGSIKYLGKGRRNPYAVHPPTTEFNLDGIPQTPKALCYVPDWMVGFSVLTAYKAGTYYEGMEQDLIELEKSTAADTLAQQILADYNREKAVPEEQEEQSETFAEVYEKFYDYKYNQDKSRTYSESAKYATRAAYKNSKKIHNKIFKDIRHPDLQKVVDDCPLKHASLELIVSLMHQMYKYAMIYEIVDKDYSAAVKINIEDDDEHGEPFTFDDLKILWDNKDDPVVEFILIMCYSGYRIAAYKNLEINLDEKYFNGGVKTRSSKCRTVPIHSGIFDMVSGRLSRYGNIMRYSDSKFREDMYATLETLNIKKHTPHDCRHTFSMLCEKYKVDENDRKRMLGHSFGNDITNRIYGHRSVEDLRVEIEKIQICY